MNSISFIRVFVILSFVFISFSSVSYGIKYYQKTIGGVPFYTNVPPRHKGYRVITLEWNKGYKKKSPGSFTYSDEYDHIINRASGWYGVDRVLVKAIIKVESDFKPHAVSSKGAMGIMQLMPQTAKRFGVTSPYNPSDNINGGVKYFKKLMDMFNGDKRLALAGYNAGENAVVNYGYQIPPYPETMNYVEHVLIHYGHLKINHHKESNNLVLIPSSKEHERTGYRNVDNNLDNVAKIKSMHKHNSYKNHSNGINNKTLNKVTAEMKYTVQIASYSELKSALEVQNTLQSKAYPAFVSKAELPGRGTWYRVRVGTFPTKIDAILFSDDIKSKEPLVKNVLVTTY